MAKPSVEYDVMIIDDVSQIADYIMKASSGRE